MPKMLTEKYKTKCLGSALTFFEHYAVEGDDFLKQIITDKETWVTYQSRNQRSNS